jgi:hypothetical protein
MLPDAAKLTFKGWLTFSGSVNLRPEKVKFFIENRAVSLS